MFLLFNTPLFGIIISLIAFVIGSYIYKKTNMAILNPFVVSVGIIIIFLLNVHIPFEIYNKGGKFISFFLGPATVVLAVPMYKQIPSLKKHIQAIFIGIITGVITSISIVYLLSKIFNLSESLIISLIPKSITTPLGIALSNSLGGISSITALAISITGVFGAIIAPFVCKIFKIHHPVAKGIAVGTASHALGTSKALEMGETEGAMSSLSIALTGIFTVLLAPLFVYLFSL